MGVVRENDSLMENLKLVARLQEKTIPSCSSYVVIPHDEYIIYVEDHIYFKDREEMTGELKGWKS